MGVWRPTKHAKWIIPLTTIPFIIIGIVLLKVSSSIPIGAEGQFGMSRQDELFYLGLIFIIAPLVGYAWMFFWIGRGQKRAEWLIENGIKGKATILAYEETGLVVNDTPKIELSLEIRTSGDSTHKIVHNEFISILYLSKLSIGKQLPVFVDPRNINNIYVDLEQLKYE
ncbi:MAG: hypothetical protein K8R53_07200 [Bacteroidales bacterium]|nr:hypothetical protein [Bacteroidales bacterium]